MRLFPDLRKLFKEKGASHGDVAAELHLSDASFSQRMNGRTPFGMDEAYAILDMFGVRHSKLAHYFPAEGRPRWSL